MDKEFLIKLSLGVYRVTEVFPEKEPLKFEVREKANGILADLILIFPENPGKMGREEKKRIQSQILGNIEVLKGYFELAKAQRWVDERNFFVLAKEYDKIGEEINKEILKKGKKPSNPLSTEQIVEDSSSGVGNERRRKILEVLKQKEKAQVKDLKEIFPQVTKRTLRRDFEYLLGQGLVERVGRGKGTIYKVNRTLLGHQ